MTKWLNTTKEQRIALTMEHQDACTRIANELDTLEKKIEVLTDNNKEKIAVREEVLGNIKQVKKNGKCFFIPGIIVAVIGMIALISNVALGVLGIVAGIILVFICIKNIAAHSIIIPLLITCIFQNANVI